MTDKSQSFQHLDELEIDINSELAGTLDAAPCLIGWITTGPNKTDNVRVCVKKEKRRRRSSAKLAALTKQPVFYERAISASR
jgi:hypothetical protein